MCLLDIGCAVMRDELMPLEVKRAYDYAVPKYMDADCYVKDHEEIIRIGLYILGQRFALAQYSFREDGDMLIFGGDKGLCNYFISLLDCGSFKHFVRTDRQCQILYNPGRSTGPRISLRGYCVKKSEG